MAARLCEADVDIDPEHRGFGAADQRRPSLSGVAMVEQRQQ